FLIDSGSGSNIIKKRFLKYNVLINRNEILKKSNPGLKKGYVPKLNLAEGVYLGNALIIV
ncbi:hypothetical protein ALC56_11634, partial [Trachymyrmex septentrionalis]